MAGVWPLTGRAEELRFVDAAIGRPGSPGGIVLAGAAGVGKTRLAREAMATARRRGLTSRWAVGTTSAQVLPLGALAPLLGTGTSQPLAAASSALLAGSGPAGLVIGVDDAHLLDEASALLVHQLVLQETATVVLTLRSGEPAPDAITALWKDGHLDRLEVQPLSQAETETLLRTALGGPVETGAADRMWALTQGNALYLRHLVDGERDAGRLRPIRGVWCWPDPPELSPGLAELVGGRIGDLDRSLGEILDLLALAEPLDVAVLDRLGSPAALEQAEARGLVETESSESGLQVRLAHPLYGQVRRAQLGPLRARRLRGELVTALGPLNHPADTLRRALLAVDSDLRPDAELLSAGAAEAIHLLDLALAERLARAAVAAGGGFETARMLAYALTWQSSGEQAEGLLADLADNVTDDWQRAEVALVRCGNLFWPMGRPQQAEAVLTATLATMHDERCRQLLDSARSAFQASLGRHEEAISCGRRVLADAEAPEDMVLFACFGLFAALGVLGRANEIGPLADRAYGIGPRSIVAAQLSPCVAGLHISALRLSGELRESERIAALLHDRYARSAGPQRLLGVALKGYDALGRGELTTAIQCLREASAAIAFNISPEHPNCLLRLAQALAMAGDAAAARATLGEYDAVRALSSFPFLEPEVVLARAWVAAAEGARSEAITLARTAADLAADRGQPAHEVLALHAATSFGDHDTADRLARLAGQVDGPRAAAAAAHATALAGDDAAGLDAVSRQLEDMGDLLAAADAAAQAAAAHARRDQRAAQAAATARARHLAAISGAHTPALTALAQPLPLTDREREIVTLAASGLTNRQIAERLVVSLRTVEGHLYRAAAKLGTSDRRHFAALLQPWS